MAKKKQNLLNEGITNTKEARTTAGSCVPGSLKDELAPELGATTGPRKEPSAVRKNHGGTAWQTNIGSVVGTGQRRAHEPSSTTGDFIKNQWSESTSVT